MAIRTSDETVSCALFALSVGVFLREISDGGLACAFRGKFVKFACMDLVGKYSFDPIWKCGCRILVLGSLPGDESLRQRQYYAHPRNAFWKIMGDFFGFESSMPYDKRLQRLTSCGVALWDVIAHGYRKGSLDQQIKREHPNDIKAFLLLCPSVSLICCNGSASYRYLKKYFPDLWLRDNLEIMRLPSTSPAAAMFSYEQKRMAWHIALNK